MKRMQRCILIGILIALVAASGDHDRYVQVRTTKVRTAMQTWAPGVVTVKYGDRVEEIEAQGSWLKVLAKGKEGYLSGSAVTTKRVVLSAASAQNSPDQSDVLMAGKGFSEDVEDEFKRQNPSMNYSDVDKMEQRHLVNEQALASFVKGGNFGLEG